MRSPIILTFVLLLAGCSSTPPTKFYGLTPVSAAKAGHAAAADAQLVIGVGPVELPKTLDRPQLVTRRGQNEFELSEFDHWAEPLGESVPQVLAENLAVLVPARRTVIYPWVHTVEVDYQVVVRVLRFDRSEGGDTVLKVRWSLSSPPNENELVARDASYTRRPTGDDARATVEAMNFVLGEFSRDLAKAIRGLRNPAP